MSAKHHVIKTASALAVASGAAELARKRYGGRGTIFMLHSVLDDSDVLPQDNTHTSLRFLKMALDYCRSKKLEIVTLSEAMRRLRLPATEPFVCFTFDDGYRDNVTRALPLFRQYNAPLTIYVTTSFLDRSYGEYWWGQLRHVIHEAAQLEVEAIGRKFKLERPKDKAAAYRELAAAINRNEWNLEDANTLFERRGVSVVEALDRDAMTDAELVQYARDPLLEIGGHTTSHKRLAQLNDAEAFVEITQNKDYLEQLLNREVSHLAYPYGDAKSCGDRDFRLARRANFKTAVTTRFGNLFQQHTNDETALPRARFIGGCESLAFLEAQRLGLIAAMASRFGNPVVTS